MKTQKEKIIEHIKKHGSITSFEAYMDLGITQLATRISELKEKGYEFETEWITKKNKDGAVVSFKKYYLVDWEGIMDKEERLKVLREKIEINKKNALEEIQKEQMIPAMWSVSKLIDLKAQELLLNEI